MNTTKTDSSSASVDSTRAVTRGDRPTCRICCRSVHSPYARYDERGRIHEGCVSPDHGAHLIFPSEYARWYNRPVAKQIRKTLQWK